MQQQKGPGGVGTRRAGRPQNDASGAEARRSASRLSLLSLGLNLALFASCAGESPSEPHSSRTISQAMVQCDGARLDQSVLDPTAVSCDSSWAYGRYAECYQRSETVRSTNPQATSVDCEPVVPAKYEQYTCQKPNTCRHQSFGPESQVDRTRDVAVTGKCTTRRVCEPTGNCPEPLGQGVGSSARASDEAPDMACVICRNVTTCSYDSACSAAANAAAVASTSTAQSASVVSYSGSGDSSGVGNCRYTLRIVLYREGTGDVCGQHDETCTAYDKQHYLCRLVGNPLEPDQSACQTDRDHPPAIPIISQYSSPNLTYQQVLDGDSRATRVAHLRPRCTTANDLPMSNAQEAKAKFDTLESYRTNPAANAADPGLAVAATRNQQLLFELRGSLLSGVRPGGTETYLDRVVLNTAAYPTARVECGTWLPNLTTGPLGSASIVDARLLVCDRLSQAHVAAELAGQQTPYCVATAPLASALDLGTLRAQLLRRWETTATSAVKRFLSAPIPEVAVPVAELSARLKLLQSFYEAAASGAYEGVYDDSQADERLWRDLESAATSALAGAHARGRLALRSGGATFQQFVNEQLQGDRDLIRAALSVEGGASSLSGPPLLYVLTAGLRGISDRTEELSPYHDLACRFQGCAGVRTELYELQRLLGNLHDPAVLRAELTASTKLNGEWKNIFDLISTNHASTIQAAVKSAIGVNIYSPSLLLNPPATTLTGSWVRTVDKFGPKLRLIGSKLTGEWDNAFFLHRMNGDFDPVTQKAALRVTRYFKGVGSDPEDPEFEQPCTTTMTGSVTVKAPDLINITITGTDGKCDIGTGYSESFDYTRTSPQVAPAPLLGLRPLINANRERFARYQTTGRFDGLPRGSLKIGLVPDRLNAITVEFDPKLTAASAAISTFQGKAQKLGIDLVNEADNEARGTGLGSQIAQRAVELRQLSEDRIGLRANAEADELRFAGLARAFSEVLNALSSSTPFKFQATERPITLSVSAKDAKFSVSRAAVDALAVGQAKQLTAQSGSLVEISAENTWAPVCALGPEPKVAGSPVTTPPAFGPEGFMLTKTSDHYDSSSHETSKSNSWSERAALMLRACLASETKIGSPEWLGTSTAIKLTLEACASIEGAQTYTATDADLTSSGASNRMSANYSMGVRLPNTPFPMYPAGSLLAVSVRAGRNTFADIVDVKVVQRDSVLMPTEPVDVYLVVNDLSCGEAADGSKALTVKIQQQWPLQGGAADSYFKAVVAAQKSIHDDASLRVTQGSLTASDISLLRSTAELAFATQCRAGGLDPALLPNELMAFFSNVVDLEMARAERLVQMTAIQRRTEILRLEMESLAKELDSTNQKSGLLAQMTELDLRALDSRELRDPMNAVFDHVNDLVFPYVAIAYPNSDVSPLNNLLSSITLEKHIDELATEAIADLKVVRDNIVSAVNLSPIPQYKTIALAFPRPGSADYRPLWREADSERSRILWQQIESNAQSIVVTVKPEDLYERFSGRASLACSDRAPVIHSMGVFVAVPPLEIDNVMGYNHTGEWVATDVSGVMTWPGDQGPESYMFDGDPGWITAAPTVQYGPIDFALTSFDTYPTAANPSSKSRSRAGSSVFGTFIMGGGAAGGAAAKLNPTTSWTENPDTGELTPVNHATAIVLVFGVDYRSGPRIGWLSSCSQ